MRDMYMLMVDAFIKTLLARHILTIFPRASKQSMWNFIRGIEATFILQRDDVDDNRNINIKLRR